MTDPIWKRSRLFRYGLYFSLGLPLVWFSLYEGLVLLVLIAFVVEFACFPGTTNSNGH
ncbi:MAG: hypothetical protein JMN27_10755 [gamma proteobacterium endosymbiont of Lamellibrachia anaximandri]|nr:hypothetical protein [gamma proteobacterium endosymbiont of Lamellibrachia anaximandri]MBL3534301.1 hypothetical protein [gamma proteobacterium endosymbiont of Lamellibrachia anaximandri]MBL3599969.1 hypothetical protein [gamma proteobacterium endosymbiont of Lamellibrachia anaximandri]